MKGSICAAMVVLLASVAGTTLAETAAASEPVKPKVEVVFVLDTTGSMGGLIQAAKEKVWAIANTLATAKPAPDIKMGLVGYRDRGDDYVTKVTDLTDDLDAVYGALMGLQANGGGDMPESVNQALHEAITKIVWAPKSDKVFQVIFLVGDCPPHMDYENDVKYTDSCKRAIERGIYVNTIQCGAETATQPIWSEIARLAEGRYFRVEQHGSAILADTPFDAELAGAARELDETMVYYGAADVREGQARRKISAMSVMRAAPEKAAAQRAVFNAGVAGATNLMGKQELVDGVVTGGIALEEVKETELPEEMRTMSAVERKAYIEELAGRRAGLQAKINDLAKKRQAHLETQVQQLNLDGKQTFDHGVFDCIKEQAGKKGIKYTGGPAL